MCDLALHVPVISEVWSYQKRSQASHQPHLHRDTSFALSGERRHCGGLLTSFSARCGTGESDSLLEMPDAELHILSAETMWLWPESLPAGEAGGSVAQIDHEEGNQSVLREVWAYIIISTPLKKKIRCSL